MKKYDFDVVMIGGGAGGLFGASVAKALKANVCIVEKDKLGGDCTWYGCVPSKALLRSAHVAQYIRQAASYGLTSEGRIGTEQTFAHVQRIVEDVATHHKPEDLEKRGIHTLFGPPRFIGREELEVNGRTIRAKRFVLCTGSHPVVPSIPGLHNVSYLTNKNVFQLKDIPKSLIVLGAGPIGCELAQAFQRLGAKVHLVEMEDRLLSKEEPELAALVEDRLHSEGVKLWLGQKAVECAQIADQVSMTLEGKDGKPTVIHAEKLLIAVGRAPNTSGLNLETAGIAFDTNGVQVNAYLQTTNPQIFACGDVAGSYQFSHVTAYQAGVCMRNALFKRIVWQKIDYDNVSWATFTDPEVAHLGLTEEEAGNQFKNIQVYTTPYTNSDRAVTDIRTDGLLKVITDKRGRILGAHIAGANAAEIIQGLLIAKAQKIPLAKIAQTMFIYPTLSELVKKTAAKPLVATGDKPLVKWFLHIMKGL